MPNRRAKTIKDKKPWPVSIQPGYTGKFEQFYANYASVSHTPTEMCIDFCMIAPPHQLDVGAKRLEAPVVARVIIPGQMANGLITALQKQIAAFGKDKRANKIVVSAPRKSSE